jgi:ribosomal protein S18 acetylase RimI-like enzyme
VNEEMRVGDSGIVLRQAKEDDGTAIVLMVREMVADMAGYGGYAPASGEAWNQILSSVADELKRGNVKYLIAQAADGARVGVGIAELVTVSGAFAPKQTIHISVLYVLPSFRRAGLGSRLVTSLLDWGRAAGAEQCTLSVLPRNPANALYEKLGFSVYELRMSRPL